MNRRILVLILMLSAIPCAAQTPGLGFPPYNSFENGKFDSINLQNLNAVIRIPILSVPGRGLNSNFAITYNSNFWNYNFGWWTPSLHNMGWQYIPSAGNQSYSADTETCDMSGENYTHWSNFEYTDQMGTTHTFSADVYDQATDCGNYPVLSTDVYADDGSGWHAVIQMPYGMTVYDPQGTKYTPFSVTDRNGNELTQVTYFNPVSMKDSAGRIVLTVTQSTSAVTYQYVDSGGTARTATLNLQPFSVKTAFGCPSNVEFSMSGLYLPTSLNLPNGQSYTFTYEPTPGSPGWVTGRVQRVTLPTGGYYEYDYPTSGGGFDCTNQRQAYLTRTINDGSSSQTWNYTSFVTENHIWPDPDSGRTVIVTTVTPPQLPYDSLPNEQTLTSIRFGGTDSIPSYASSATNETIERDYRGWASSNQLLKTVETYQWWSGIPFAVNTTLDNGLQSRVLMAYGAFQSISPTTVQEYNWGSGGPGSLLRTTNYSYLGSSPYIGANLLKLVTQKTVQDGSGNTVSREDTAYDGASPSCISGVVQHDDTNYPCSYNTRGNPTSVTDYSNAAAGTGGLTTTIAYDSLGNAVSTTDPGGHTTSISYADSWGNSACSVSSSYAYPTSVTNALSQVNQTKYFPCTGAVAATTDPNNQTTSFSYDVLGRLIQTNYPDGGQTSVTYNDASHNIVATQKIDSSRNIAETTLFNGLGLPIQSQLNSDPSGTDYTDTTYDALGRVASVSNPYRSTSDPTYGITSYAYDALGRPTTTTLQDNNQSSITYSGNCSNTFDPASKKQGSCTDVAGRLVAIWEPDGSNNLTVETDYTYDVLDNLTGVNQGGQTRTFVYDSLSRLTSATNPESGTATYTYDSDSNVHTRTDARSITTTYSYDVLNRVTLKTYSDGVTPNAYFAYDSTGWWGISQANTIGRMMAEWTGTSCCASGGEHILSYDPMGRVVLRGQYVPGGSYFYASATYDFNGDPITYNNGLGVTFTQSFDTAARITQITSSLVDSQHPGTLMSAAAYAPNSAPSQFTYGNGLIERYAYNNRLQPSQIRTSFSSGTDRLNLTYGYTDGSGHNNGNLQNWNASGWDQVFMRSYGYDNLNRLASMTSPADPQGCNGLSWTYDRWGNRTAQTTTSGSCPNTSVSYSGGNNRMDGYTYDAVGNVVYDGAHNYTYDAENRLISVDAGVTATYSYDALGNRNQTNHGSWQMEYIYGVDGLHVGDWQINPSSYTGPMAHYIYMNGQMFAQYSNSTTYFAHKDHLGSTRVLTKVDATGYDNYDYLPFGELMSGGGGSINKFTGYEYDSESGNNFAQARYHSPRLGRFLSPDPDNAGANPLAPQTWNAYSYIANNPLIGVDPTGLDCIYISDSSAYSISGDCVSDTDNGIFVDGTVSSLTFDPFHNSIGYNFVNEEEDSGGSGIVQLDSPFQNGTPDFSEFWNLGSLTVSETMVMPPGSRNGSVALPFSDQQGLELTAIQQKCVQDYLHSSLNGRIASKLIPTFSLYSFVPGNPNFSAAANGVKETAEVKGTLYAAGRILSNVLDKPAIAGAANVAAKGLGYVGSGLSAYATAEEARARAACGAPTH